MKKRVLTMLLALVMVLSVTVPALADGPQAPAGGNGWVFYDGDDYYFINGRYVTNYWVGNNGGSKWNLWYYIGSDGRMAKGFQYIVNENGTGWYMLEDGYGSTRGQMLTGWQDTGFAGWGFFFQGRGSEHGMCTWTDAWGDYNASTGLWADGQFHR